MCVCFQSVGSLPVVRDVLNMIDSGMLMPFANSFMTLGWRLQIGAGFLFLLSLALSFLCLFPSLRTCRLSGWYFHLQCAPIV